MICYYVKNNIGNSDAELLQELKEFYIKHQHMSDSYVHSHNSGLYQRIRKYMGLSIRKAAEMAGLPYHNQSNHFFYGEDGELYASKNECYVGNILHYLSGTREIHDYTPHVNYKQWNVDFEVFTIDGESVFLEHDGCSHIREISYDDPDHPKIKSFKEDDINFLITKGRRSVGPICQQVIDHFQLTYSKKDLIKKIKLPKIANIDKEKEKKKLIKEVQDCCKNFDRLCTWEEFKIFLKNENLGPQYRMRKYFGTWQNLLKSSMGETNNRDINSMTKKDFISQLKDFCNSKDGLPSRSSFLKHINMPPYTFDRMFKGGGRSLWSDLIYEATGFHKTWKMINYIEEVQKFIAKNKKIPIKKDFLMMHGKTPGSFKRITEKHGGWTAILWAAARVEGPIKGIGREVFERQKKCAEENFPPPPQEILDIIEKINNGK